MKKLLLVDGNAVLHRAYYALPDWRNRSGEATAGVYGFLSMLLRAIEELKPTHLVVMFDTPEPTFRHLMYVGYQTNREKERQVSEDIWGQVEKLKIVFAKMGVPVFAVEGFEADDVIGTISGQIKNSNLQMTNQTQNSNNLEGEVSETIIITGDKDLMQLVDEHTYLYMPQKGLSDNQIIDTEKVKEKLGVGPDQVIDYKALVGDSSDNYPGVTGIGPKTAVDLLKKFGSFENIYLAISSGSQLNSLSISLREEAEKLGLKLRLRLADGYEGGELSKRLATIKRDVPITIHPDEAVVPGQEKILGVLKELGYKSLIKRVGGETDEKSKSQIGLFD